VFDFSDYEDKDAIKAAQELQELIACTAFIKTVNGLWRAKCDPPPKPANN
jgi:hypothetical protein